MAAILPMLKLDENATLSKHFAVHQIHWIEDEDQIHAQGKQVCALAEKSIRIGWTFADSFKNVRKRLRFKKRDYLFVTKDYPSALEYMGQAWDFAELFNLTKAILSHGEESLKIPRLDERGRSSGFTEEIKVGVIKFDTGSRIIAFSSSPQAMAVYGGDVGLDEFAKHPNARLLWETAQGRVALANDIAVWSSHDGEDTLFYQFCQQARAAGSGKGLLSSFVKSTTEDGPSLSSTSLRGASARQGGGEGEDTTAAGGNGSSRGQGANCSGHFSPWNLYYRVTMPDAIELGFLEIINRVKGSRLQPEQFLADCKARAGLPEIYEQAYLCNPAPPAASIVDWSAIERCRQEYEIERLHLDHAQVQEQFGSPVPHLQVAREQKIAEFLHSQFPALFGGMPLRTRGGVGALEDSPTMVKSWFKFVTSAERK